MTRTTKKPPEREKGADRQPRGRIIIVQSIGGKKHVDRSLCYKSTKIGTKERYHHV